MVTLWLSYWYQVFIFMIKTFKSPFFHSLKWGLQYCCLESLCHAKAHENILILSNWAVAPTHHPSPSLFHLYSSQVQGEFLTQHILCAWDYLRCCFQLTFLAPIPVSSMQVSCVLAIFLTMLSFTHLYLCGCSFTRHIFSIQFLATPFPDLQRLSQLHCLTGDHLGHLQQRPSFLPFPPSRFFSWKSTAQNILLTFQGLYCPSS